MLILYRLAEGTRKAVEGWGLKLLCREPRWNSDSLTVIKTPEVCPSRQMPPYYIMGSIGNCGMGTPKLWSMDNWNDNYWALCLR